MQNEIKAARKLEQLKADMDGWEKKMQLASDDVSVAKERYDRAYEQWLAAKKKYIQARSLKGNL
jgi:hypothetical protein